VYVKEVFRARRDELDVEVTTTPKRLPYVPTEAEIRRYPRDRPTIMTDTPPRHPGKFSEWARPGRGRLVRDVHER
jgi:hypothetical protein